MLKVLASIILSGLLVACSGTQLLNSVAMNPGKIERNIAYGQLPRQKLDVYSPKTMTNETPVIVFYHGGSWQSGSKDDYRFLGAALAARGIQTVVINYRLYPDAIFPTFVEDGAKALVFTQRNLAQGRPIFVMGHSAGAHIASMIALDPRFLAVENTSICNVAKGLVGIAGPYEFTPVAPEFKAIFPAEILPSTKPINFARNPSPPTLLLHGTADTTVLPIRTTEMANAMRAGGNTVEVKTYAGVDHLYIIGAISPVVRRTAPTLIDIVNFVGEQKASGYPGCQRR